MARPIKHNADYFSHDNNMRDDKKIKALRRKFGLTGYAVYCMTLETIAAEDFFRYLWDDLNIELMVGDFEIEPDLLKEIIDYCVNKIKVLQIEDGYLICNGLSKRMQPLLKDREKRRNKGVSHSQNPQSKVKESKEQEIKEKKKDKEQKSGQVDKDFERAMKELQRITVDRLLQPYNQNFLYREVSKMSVQYKMSYKELGDIFKAVTTKAKPMSYVYGILNNKQYKNPTADNLPPELAAMIKKAANKA